MRLKIFVYNRSQAVRFFLPEAFTLAEQYRCEIHVRCAASRPTMSENSEFLPVKLGRVTEMEIWVEGNEAEQLLLSIRRCLSQYVGAVNYQMSYEEVN